MGSSADVPVAGLELRGGASVHREASTDAGDASGSEGGLRSVASRPESSERSGGGDGGVRRTRDAREPRELVDAAAHPAGRKAVVAWMVLREVGAVYVPLFGLAADYAALLARPVTRRLAGRLAAAAAYRRPPGRLERRRAAARAAERAAWRELELSPGEVAVFLATP